MPFKSKAQRAKFAEMLKQGKITQATFDEWNKDTAGKELPERIKPKVRNLADVKNEYKKRFGVK